MQLILNKCQMVLYFSREQNIDVTNRIKRWTYEESLWHSINNLQSSEILPSNTYSRSFPKQLRTLSFYIMDFLPHNIL